MASDYTVKPDAKAGWAAHVRLIREMGAEDDVANVRSCAVLRRAQGKTDPELVRGAHPDDPWIPRALAILNEERAARGLGPHPAPRTP